MGSLCPEEMGQNHLHDELVKCWFLKRTHTFEHELPKMVNKAYVIDEKNGNTLWQDAIQKEMESRNITFQTIAEGKKPPNGF